jgi:hypothetical protein
MAVARQGMNLELFGARVIRCARSALAPRGLRLARTLHTKPGEYVPGGAGKFARLCSQLGVPVLTDQLAVAQDEAEGVR